MCERKGENPIPIHKKSVGGTQYNVLENMYLMLMPGDARGRGTEAGPRGCRGAAAATSRSRSSPRSSIGRSGDTASPGVVVVTSGRIR